MLNYGTNELDSFLSFFFKASLILITPIALHVLVLFKQVLNSYIIIGRAEEFYYFFFLRHGTTGE